MPFSYIAHKSILPRLLTSEVVTAIHNIGTIQYTGTYMGIK